MDARDLGWGWGRWLFAIGLALVGLPALLVPVAMLAPVLLPLAFFAVPAMSVAWLTRG